MRNSILSTLGSLFLFLGSVRGSANYPPLFAWQPDPGQREHLRRSLRLLNASSSTNHATVLVLIYGQSISQQNWWREVERYLRVTYPNANLILENRAIGGHASQLLVKTAEADLYPFQPDLVIFHVYGSHIEYDNIIRRLRERTCADILLQTDHITRDEMLEEETDPSKLTPKQWDAWMNHVFLPGTAEKYGACRADIHEQWKVYLRKNHLKAADLLKDGVHLNAQGEWLMAELVKAYLAPLPSRAGYDPFNDTRVRTEFLQLPASATTAQVQFDGTRVDVIFRTGAAVKISVRIDGQKPSSLPELYGFTRVSPYPNSDWPLLLRVGSRAPLVEEQWSVVLSDVADQGHLCHFSLRGSFTGADGEGWCTNHFVSNSGRVTIEPEDWNLAYCMAVFGGGLPQGFAATWKSVLRGADEAAAPPGSPGIEACVTVAQSLKPGHHQLDLSGVSLGQSLQAVRFYNPGAAASRP